MKRLYFDHAATTFLRPEVREAIIRTLEADPANPASLHDPGQHAKLLVEQARTEIAEAFHASPREIIFTGSGTEANNMAVLGAARKRRKRGNHVITSQVEHPSVLEACRQLEREGFRVTYLPVDKTGQIRIKELEQALSEETILVSVMAANNEVGTLMPIQEIAALTKDKGILFHTDAVQYFGKFPVDVQKLGVDLLSIGGHKIGGPKGIGVLYLRNGIRLQPNLFGGGQERGLRPGTLNVPAIVGMGVACHLAATDVLNRSSVMSRIQNLLWERINQEIGDVQLNGHPHDRLPNHLNIRFDRLEGQAVMLELNRRNVAVSTSSACSSGKQHPSHVLTSMGLSDEESYQSLRITWGPDTTEEEIDQLVKRLKTSIEELRSRLPVL
ncbi:cysteine desulfurase family protein [Melghirimyces algeriensis]|uniref:cysteine desulfurase n=1 Tax=Melghirimyces algeriensis TaxID=910412 RepID=A0A521ERH0_9BACL|nr:cysteine desulfurase family protein [Melghirimyces algeriensis]SMO85700.1 cysteine desulfurase [Melghirimyces algeriensis]